MDLLGDLNSRLQRHAENGRLAGKWFMHTCLDRGGKQLENVMEKYCLRGVSTFFQPARDRAPCSYINKVPSLAPSQVDYIIVSERGRHHHGSSKVRWGPSIRRFGRGKYDQGLAADVFQHRLTAERERNEMTSVVPKERARGQDPHIEVQQRATCCPRSRCERLKVAVRSATE